MPDLDGLRATAILLVLVSHFVSPCIPIKWASNVGLFGWCGVDLFFVLSGFLIGGILLDHRESTNYFKVFYLRRFFRIIPLYLLILSPLIVIVALGVQRHFAGRGLGDAGWGTVLVYLMFQQNVLHAFPHHPGYLGPAWSLSIEEEFYLLLPPMVRNLRPAALVKWLLPAVFLTPVIRVACYVLSPSHGAGLAGLLLPCRWDGLLLGVLIAYAMRNEPFRAWISDRLAWVRWVCIVLAAGVAGLAICEPKFSTEWSQVFGYTWIALFFAAILLLSRANERGMLRHWLSRPVWKPLATISYGLYLFQGPTMAVREAVVERLGYPYSDWRTIGIFAAFLGLTFALAMVSWRFFEGPILRKAHRQYEWQYGSVKGD
jgi:peptidoglycan/LPS O-acetylase OafA/YrhL